MNCSPDEACSCDQTEILATVYGHCLCELGLASGSLSVQDDGHDSAVQLLYAHSTSAEYLIGLFPLLQSNSLGSPRVCNGVLLAAKLINQLFAEALPLMMWTLLNIFGKMLALFDGMLAITTIMSLLAQVGFMLATKAVGFKGRKINPVSNLKQIFSLHSLIELVKSCLKVILLCLIFLAIFYHYALSFQVLPYCDASCAIPFFSTITRWIWYALLMFGVFDYAFQSHNTLKQQRMSKEDVK